eukprot:TRINITY_DN920_c0_g1_i3.p1 TRINITY_DN920_c0_g1~~TRINITY_DN920_c0_g1_i3.p1  ORF type:complete len:571 (+),score=195.72 TRINITY_DN920_c0_g1_i3:58-1713(+)
MSTPLVRTSRDSTVCADDEYGTVVGLDEASIDAAMRTDSARCSRTSATCTSVVISDGQASWLLKEDDGGTNEDDASAAAPTALEAEPTPVTAEVPEAPVQQQASTECMAADWRTTLVAVYCYALLLMLVLSTSGRRGVPEVQEWHSNPKHAFPDLWNAVGSVAVGAVMVGAVTVSEAGSSSGVSWSLPAGLVFSWTCVLGCFWAGSQQWMHKNGLGAEILSLIVGLLVKNLCPRRETETGKRVWRLGFLDRVAGLGEGFVKCGIALMVLRLDKFAAYGAPGVVMGWGLSPVTIAFTFWLGTRVLKCCSEQMCLLLGCGMGWCGASAIMSVAKSIRSDSSDVSAAVGLICFTVVPQSFVLAYLAKVIGMDEIVAGGWLGACVDQTANVVMSGAIVSFKAKQVATSVKLILNAGLGVMCTAVAMFWSSRHGGQRPSVRMVWDKFPRFVLGFLFLSGVTTALLPHLDDEQGDELQKSAAAMSAWWMALGMFCLGLNTDLIELRQHVGGSVLLLYGAGGLLDIVLKYGAAKLLLSGVLSPVFSRPSVPTPAPGTV